MNILIVEGNADASLQRAASDGMPGPAEAYARVLRHLQPALSVSVIHPYREGFIAAEIECEKFQGAVFTGSCEPWSADGLQAAPQRLMMERLFDSAVPVMGSCNGLHLGALVLGGAVGEAAAGTETGIAKNIRLTEAGKEHPLHHGRSSVYSAFCVHRDEVNRVPQGAKVTAGNAHTGVQGMVYEQDGVRFWGVQYHPELEIADICHYINDKDGLFAEGKGIAASLMRVRDGENCSSAELGQVKDADLQLPRRTLELANWLKSLH